MLNNLTLADSILTGVFPLTGALTQIATPTSWQSLPKDILGLELWSTAAWTLSYSAAGDAVAVPADAVIRINIRCNLAKNALLIPEVFVSGAGNLQILAHRRATGYSDQGMG
jgi:DNA-binding transcriptional regulator/RsmH inhibitor MraZ